MVPFLGTAKKQPVTTRNRRLTGLQGRCANPGQGEISGGLVCDSKYRKSPYKPLFIWAFEDASNVAIGDHQYLTQVELI